MDAASSTDTVKEATVAARNIRILIAKPGLDGHDRGAKGVAHALMEAGMEVIYTGLHRTVDQIVTIALQEDVDVIGLSIMSGAHIPIAEKLVQKARAAGIGDKMVVVGGVIPGRDIPKLKELGVRGVFPGGTLFAEIVSVIKENVRRG
jgi:methylmalonyl-CoA mutase C-terminal domain/subunit